MEKLIIICIDDQREVLGTLRKDLNVFSSCCNIVECESANEAEELLEEIHEKEEPLALIICDHIMPGKNGIDLFIEINKDARFPNVKKMLLTGLATQEDTIIAINKAHIDRYVEKPWHLQNLQKTIKLLLAEFISEAGMNKQEYSDIVN